MLLRITALFILTISALSAEVHIIPKPLKVEVKQGSFFLKKNVAINFPKSLTNEGKLLRDELKKRRGVNAKYSKSAQILLRLDTSSKIKALGEEGYTLDVTPKGVIVRSSTAHGVYYGIQSLIQLIPTKPNNGSYKLDSVTISDKPRFPWRASHIDVSRHFYDVDFIKSYLDYMAMHKLNTFHWHLTDHQGWRMEVKKYPKLTSVGAWRKIENINHYGVRSLPTKETPEEIKARLIKDGLYKEIDGVPHYGGFYTTEQMKEVVAYAAARHITVVPEIDVPGHTQAALAAYPKLGCTNITTPYKVWTRWGLGPAIICAGAEDTYEFTENVFDEVLEIFPSKLIHIGADEAHPGIVQHWEKCDDCAARIEKENLKNAHDLQNYFVNRTKKYLDSKGRTTIAWGEAFYKGMDTDTVIMSWWDTSAGERAAAHGNPVVMTPYLFSYFNMKVDPNENGPGVRLSHLPVEMVYNYEPSPLRYSETQRKNIIGYQPCIWTEEIPTTKDVEFLTYPRIAASSEVAWTQMEQRDFSDFKKRLETHYKRFDLLDIFYFVDPPVDALQNLFNYKIKTNISSDFPKSKVYIKRPGATKAELYNKPITLTETSALETWAVAESGISSLPYSLNYQKVDIQPTKLDKPKRGLKFTKYKLDKREDNLNNATEESTGFITDLNLPSEAKGDNFAVIIEGYIYIKKDQSYSLRYTKVDDVLKVKIAGQEVLNNRRQKNSVSFTFSPGFYPIRIEFYEYGGAEIMDLELTDKDGNIVEDMDKLFGHE